ncbi:MAG: hybrid sensor histidine kinase/response regulator [Acidobacteria bacterium]|nr:MAG: hybrid sensor histidine kinase/response regulator [Acidobacteriota bacterium]
MSSKIKVLHLEDAPLDAELLDLSLRRTGIDWDILRVDTRDDFVAALDRGGFDVIVSDFRLPAYDGLQALQEASTRRPEVPFVFFTGNLGEARAIQALKSGATDYVLKDGAVERLAPAIQRAVREAAERRARAQAEDALKQSEEGFRQLFNCNPHPTWVFDVETLRFVEVNDAAIEHYGYSREEFRGMRITDLHPSEEVPLVEEAVATPKDGIRRFGTWVHRTKDGRLINVDVAAHDLEFRGRRGRLVVAHDITQQQELQVQLQQSQKMDAIGRLAGGVAHDFNNLLGVIIGYGERLLRRLPSPDRREINEVLKAAEHAASLTRQLLAFSRRQVLKPRVLDLNAVVGEMDGMLRRIIGEDIDLVTVLQDGLGQVKADPGQIQQVVMNLAVNARDAMPKGGRLTIETGNAELDESYTSAHLAVRSGHYVMLAVTDSGMGMDAATQARIFEPFFTTKEAGKGTGLGLSTVFGIVKQSEGNVWVYSEPQRGTTFKIYLPRVDEVVEEQPAQEAETAAGGSETILLVEDSDSLRELGREILEEHGYKVIEASSGAAALEALARHTGSLDLILTDLVMSGMSGRELADQVTRLRPGTKVIFMSGYTDDALGHHGVLETGTAFVEKPFTIDGLLRKVRDVLDSGRIPS